MNYLHNYKKLAAKKGVTKPSPSVSGASAEHQITNFWGIWKSGILLISGRRASRMGLIGAAGERDKPQ